MTKPLKVKNYGSIPHFSFSRLGPGDYHFHEGQEEICILNSKGRRVIVQIKLDGSNVGVARVNGELVPLMRAGYTALSSKYEMHHLFHQWAMGNKKRFGFLKEGERIAGEWLAQAHGTRYNLIHEPFVPFDIFTPQNKRLTFAEFSEKVRDLFVTPYLIHNSRKAFSHDELAAFLGNYDSNPIHGELDPVEGAIYRVEDDAKQEVLFLCKYVRQSKVDGKYLDQDIWNWRPNINIVRFNSSTTDSASQESDFSFIEIDGQKVVQINKPGLYAVSVGDKFEMRRIGPGGDYCLSN